VVVTGGSWQRLTQLNFALGDLLLLLGNLCWAAYGVMAKRMVKKLSALQTTAVTMLIGAAAIGGLAIAVHGGTLALPPHGSLAALCVMALFGTVVAYLCWNNGISIIGPARTSVFIDLVPIFTMLIAIGQGEKVFLAQWLGAVLVMTGVLFSSGALETWLKPVAPAAS
jgi:drug/metabolite transporter (DMT)-like permease